MKTQTVINICLAVLLIFVLCVIVPVSVIETRKHAEAQHNASVTTTPVPINAPVISTSTVTATTATATPQNCGTSSDWAASPAAYLKANTDNEVEEWWSNSTAQSQRFDTLIFESFGSRQTQARCGLREPNNCEAPGCSGMRSSIRSSTRRLTPFQCLSRIKIQSGRMRCKVL
jgi:hypothetical protein